MFGILYLESIKNIRLFLEFSSFFRCYNVGLHVYNSLPNGRRVSIRLDSGLITGVCRQFNIGSVTYQSRVPYHIDYKIAYDVFDKYYVWGSCWKRYFEKRNFIKSFEIIGNVFLDDYRYCTAEVKNKLVIFLTDIEEKVPQHHDFYYVESFLVELIYAVQQCQRGICENNKIIDIKIKNFQHKFWLLENARIRDALKHTQVALRFYDKFEYDLKQVLQEASRVISIGFTTPGLEALLLGIPSVYFSPYRSDYFDLFNGQSELVVHNRSEIREFLERDVHVSDELQNDLDPFRDGLAGSRLVNFCFDLIND